MTAGDAVLTLHGVTIRFGGLVAVNDLSLTVPRGGIVGLIGPNGAGKTSAFNIITGFYMPTEGYVAFRRRSGETVRITGLPPHRVCATGLARTFQNIRLFRNETALENVMIGAHVRQKSHWWQNVVPFVFPGAAREETKIRERAEALLDRLGLGMTSDYVPAGN